MSRGMLLVAGLCAWSSAAIAQQPVPSPSYTQMILGMGYTTSDPAFLIGFEHKPKDSRVAWRAMLEYQESFRGNMRPADGEAYFVNSHQIYGVQLLGVRLFRDTRRFQPYLLGGGGLYYRDAFSAYQAWEVQPDGSFQPTGPMTFGQRSEVTPAIIWGGGAKLRFSRITVFSELKLPMFSTGRNGFMLGPQAPLVFGIRF